MQLKAYFAQTEGIRALATAYGQGQVDAANYERPHLMEDGIIAFIYVGSSNPP